jgi:esterase/lipase
MNQTKKLIPRSVGGHLHAVHFTNEKVIASEESKQIPFVIICHGFSGDKYEWGRFTETATALNEEGYESLLFDFSGSGENEREFITLSKQATDLEDVYDWVKKQGYSNVAIIGLSFGGLTLLVANLPEIKTKVFWAPGFYLQKMFPSTMVKNLKKKPLKIPTSGEFEPITIDNTFVEDISNYDANSYLDKLVTPTLIIQGTGDTTIGLENTREAFEHLPKDDHHKLVEIDDATHDFKGDHLVKFIEISINWLKQYL